MVDTKKSKIWDCQWQHFFSGPVFTEYMDQHLGLAGSSEQTLEKGEGDLSLVKEEEQWQMGWEGVSSLWSLAVSIDTKFKRVQCTSCIASSNYRSLPSLSPSQFPLSAIHQERVMIIMKNPSFPPMMISSHELWIDKAWGSGQPPVVILHAGWSTIHHLHQSSLNSWSDAMEGNFLKLHRPWQNHYPTSEGQEWVPSFLFV